MIKPIFDSTRLVVAAPMLAVLLSVSSVKAQGSATAAESANASMAGAINLADARPDGATPGQQTEPIPWAELSAQAQAQYQGDGLSVAAMEDGARLWCVFQKLEGEATVEGLWLRSTASESAEDRFRVMASAVGRTAAEPAASFDSVWLSDGFLPVPGLSSPMAVSRALQLPPAGIVSVEGRTARFTRPGLIEEYTVSMDGVRQDFVVLERPEGAGDLRLELDLIGARAEATAYGARLVLDGSGRTLSYGRLRVTDATGRELPARMEVADRAPRLAVLVDDADARYPIRIDPTFSDEQWISMGGGIPGANAPAIAAVVDGAGNLYIGGSFTVVGDILANYVAKWDGSSWSALGSGLNGGVRALAVSGGDLYVGGEFTTAGGSVANYVAKWDGSGWSALGSGLSGLVYALAVSGGDLYVGGEFTTAGGSAANYVAKWDGSGWSALGSGLSGLVYALAVSGGDLYVGGEFTTAGGSVTDRIAKWDGSSWSALGSGLDDRVYALAMSGGDLYVGGAFTTAGGSVANRIAKWDGSGWSALGSGFNNTVSALAVSGSDLYVGGQFTTAGGSAANSVAKWDGSSWTALGSGLSFRVWALAVSGSDLYVGGQFTTAGGSAADGIAKWDGSGWKALGSGLNSGSGLSRWVWGLAVSGSDLYVGGFFTTAGGSAANYVAKWDGSGWSALDSGLNDVPSFSTGVSALAVSGSDLFVGGGFTTAGGSAANRIAKWDGSSWTALGSGLGSEVRALAVSGSDLYVGGEFTTAGDGAANGIAKWDGSSWSALGLGLNNTVYALAVSGSDLYVGGQFTTAGGSAADGIAKWDGNSWSALGSGLNNTVYALVVSGSDLYVGGSFTTAGGSTANGVAKWDGSSWSALGSGLSGEVDALAVSGSDLYVGGSFATAGGSAANNVAKWDGSSWSALGSGLNNHVSALAVSGSDLYVGGFFTIAGGKVSAYVAKAVPEGGPWLQSAAGVDGTYADEMEASVDTQERTITIPISSETRFFRLRSSAAVRITNFESSGDVLMFRYEMF